MLLDFQNVTVLRKDKVALQNVSLSIAEGEHVAILGPNGSGKSTFIKVVTRECYPRLGSTVRIMGKERWNIFELRSLLGIVTNDLLLSCTRDYTGRETVISGFFSSVGVWPHHEVTPEMERKADAVLEMLEVGHLADRNLIEMSSGEARKMVIGRALVHDPKALVFDEPSNSLDFHAAHELRTTLRKLARQGISIILVTHDLGDVIPEITRTVLIKSGRIFGDGPKSEMLTSENLSELFGLQARITQENGSFHLW